MKIYQIGGAVRDKLLGISPTDFDFVVVGSSIAEMKEKGFIQVGKNFPIFLHPETKDEYALARKEIKVGPKHTDFKFVFDDSITLKEDVIRRDFTMNAIAYDIEKKELIDYVGGKKDIENKIIKHINSTHFIEDPLRVLRMCRFSAQLDFKIDADTMNLSKKMVQDGMLSHLSCERIFSEIEKALQSLSVENFIFSMKECGALKAVLPEIDILFFVPENEKFHPEKNSGLHTVLSLQKAKYYSPEVKFAVLLHDVGKSKTPVEIWPSHYGHDERGAGLVKQICLRLRVPNKYKKLAEISAKNHMLIRKVPIMSVDDLYCFVSSISEGFRNKKLMDDFFLVCQADLEGRAIPLNHEEFNNFQRAINRCKDCFACILNDKKDITKNIPRSLRGSDINELIKKRYINILLKKQI